MKEKKEHKATRMTRGMVALYLLLTLGVGAAVVANIFSIQIVHGDEWRARGEKREAGLRTEPARRGNIYSSDGKILATTVTECDLYLDLMDTLVVENGQVKMSKGVPVESGPIVDSLLQRYLDTVCQMLAEAVPQHNAQYYHDRIMGERQKDRPGRCFLVQRGVPYSVWLQICRLPGWNRGVVKNVNYRSVVRQVRAHIYGNMASNTIGFRNEIEKDSYTGLEGYYDSVLRGRDGLYNCRRLTKGIWLPDENRDGKMMTTQRTDQDRIDTVVLQSRVDGQSIVSTIDTRYQDIAESSLRKALLRYGGVSGCAILMEMQTGYVLACANLSIDTSAHNYLERRDRNVAVSHVIEPGSTFKTVALMAMLTDPETKIDTAMEFAAWHKDFGGKGGTVSDDHAVRDSEGNLRTRLNVREIIQQSSNVGMADMGMELYGNRRDRLRSRMLEIFPYDKLNPDVKAPQSRSYILEDMKPISNFTRMCFGYSTRVSPLQILTFYNAVGAGGRMVKPLFCKGVMDGDRLMEVKPVVLQQSICDRASAMLMRRMLEEVVENGTGNNIKNTTYGIAGKTGTAYHSYANTRRYNASFAGFFPSESPRYTCYVLMEDVPSYGRQAAEVFKNISDCVVAIDMGLSENGVKSAWPRLEDDSTAAMSRPTLLRGRQDDIKDIYRTLRLPYMSTDTAGTWVYYRQATDSTQAIYDNYRPTGGRVPNCIGMTAKDAIDMLHEEGYRVRVRGYGKVTIQSPKVNTPAKKGTVIELTLK